MTFELGASGSRSWRPHITNHAVGRYLQRVLKVAVPNPDQPVERQLHAMLGERRLGDVLNDMWPSRLALSADPGCAFVLKRDGFRYCVREGQLRTVTAIRAPQRQTRGDYDQREV